MVAGEAGGPGAIAEWLNFGVCSLGDGVSKFTKDMKRD